MVALETAATSERVNLACRAAYQAIPAAVVETLVTWCWVLAQAASVAVCIIAAIEVGTVLSRTVHRGDPLRLIADELNQKLDAQRPNT